MLKRFTYVAVLMLFVLVLAACGADESKNGAEVEKTNDIAAVNYANEVKENPVATITMQDGGEIVVELEPKIAPNTVANFISLVEDGFYDGVIFHRVIPGFMIQGGDPEGTGYGGPDYTIAGEFTDNDFENNLKHTRGIISMARSGDPNSAGSQFFIMHEDNKDLDNKYASFGRVLEGMEVVDAIANVKRNASDKPKQDQVIQTITVDTKGFDYPDPVIQ